MIFLKFITSAESLSSVYTHVYLVVCSSLHGYLVRQEASVVLFNDFFFNLSHLLSDYQAVYTHVYLVVCSSMHGYLVWLEASVIRLSEFLKFITSSESLSSCIHSRLFGSLQ